MTRKPKENWCEWCTHSETCMGDECNYRKRADVPKGKIYGEDVEGMIKAWEDLLGTYDLEVKDERD